MLSSQGSDGVPGPWPDWALVRAWLHPHANQPSLSAEQVGGSLPLTSWGVCVCVCVCVCVGMWVPARDLLGYVCVCVPVGSCHDLLGCVCVCVVTLHSQDSAGKVEGMDGPGLKGHS